MFFLSILLYNIYFLSIWLSTFIITIVRVHLSTLKQWTICRCLKKIRVASYDEDLKDEKEKTMTQMKVENGFEQLPDDVGRQRFEEEF